MTDYNTKLCAAETAARMAGKRLRAAFHDARQVDRVMAHDIKLRLDREMQALIIGELKKQYPEDAYLGEEGAEGVGSRAAEEWVIDPLDGTVNYFYGIPIFCVSIALRIHGRFVLGCVYDPMQDECFCAQAGQGATLNGAPIHVSARASMSEAVVFVGHGAHDGSGEAGIRRFAHVSSQVRKVRILGSAALTLCYIAAGRFDAYVENRIYLWDFAAAGVILEAAGGKLEFFPTGEDGIAGSVLAWNGALPLHESLCF